MPPVSSVSPLPAESPAAPAREAVARVHVAGLKLANFRNYAALALAFDGRPVVLTGENGAGKTNLLEAISFLSPGRGLRRAGLDEVGRRPGDGAWAVAARLAGPAGEAEIGTGIAQGTAGPEPQRRVRVNGAAAAGAEALLEHIRVVWLTPGMDGLFSGPPAERRRFLDRLVLAIDTGHGRRVAALERALTGRNRILEDFRPNAAWLDAAEAQLAELGVAVAAARVECIRLLARQIGEAQGAPSSFPAAVLVLAGRLEQALAEASATEVEDRYRDLLAAGRSADRAAGRTLEGPHRSDLEVIHAGKGTPAAAASTGEQKALLTGIVLAHARLTARLTGATPVVLLDEIAAHLDAGRRAALYELILDLGAQAFMTGTDAAAFASLGDRAQRFIVSNGSVLAED